MPICIAILNLIGDEQSDSYPYFFPEKRKNFELQYCTTQEVGHQRHYYHYDKLCIGPKIKGPSENSVVCVRLVQTTVIIYLFDIPSGTICKILSVRR